MQDGGALRTAGAVVFGCAVAGVAWTIFRRSSRARQAMKQATSPSLRPMVVVGPSGVGKGTLLELLTKEFPGKFRKCTSHTTRKAREGEVDGEHYNFVTKELMEQEISEDKFIEYANVHGNYYGTSIAGVEKVADEGSICILEIDVQGQEQVRKTKLLPFYVCILPPSKDTLRKRLLQRGSENDKTLETRLKTAESELDFMEKCDYFDLKIVNDDLQKSYQKLRDGIVGFYPQLA